ncbi:dephospho-CoA kinase [Amphibacillus xylanus]|uniref:Dephospho-CoA kinase n=1 Tax=Amphibacillus xylanus (strain ATCC 51415 / DSM 6626 / JCM 7361 / LMG 17667 / NBRC 15112 / Ep01) TaxID=698758 RepID=K0IXE8_AMPXN|nr:dephospho-CoA kinase [Amphibacillus xylanus]BAM47074.1 dephospho-CoA kinase [Amphibacillus xylanus NBRC 15112]
MTKVLGLTGSIATGKSTVAQLFIRENIPIIDADQISHQVIEPNQRAYQQVLRAFGDDILSSDQKINRKKLAELIFNDKAKRDLLNQIVHPIIIDQLIEERDRLISEGHALVVLDIPLLYELNLTNLVDKVIVVYTTRMTQLDRLMNRDQLTKLEAEQRINSQISIEEKKQKADYVIDNNGTKEVTAEQFEQLLNSLKTD